MISLNQWFCHVISNLTLLLLQFLISWGTVHHFFSMISITSICNAWKTHGDMERTTEYSASFILACDKHFMLITLLFHETKRVLSIFFPEAEKSTPGHIWQSHCWFLKGILKAEDVNSQLNAILQSSLTNNFKLLWLCSLGGTNALWELMAADIGL